MKLIIASLLIFSLVILFLFALFPADISVTRMIPINRPQAAVSKKIADLPSWRSWNELLEPGPVGGGVAAGADRMDSGHIRVAGVSVDLIRAAPDSVFTRWQHGKKTFTGNFILTEMNGQVILEWTLHFHLRWYPWEKLSGMFYDKQIGPLMERSLVKLRAELEAAQQ